MVKAPRRGAPDLFLVLVRKQLLKSCPKETRPSRKGRSRELTGVSQLMKKDSEQIEGGCFLFMCLFVFPLKREI